MSNREIHQKLMVFCAVLYTKLMALSVWWEQSNNCACYLEMLQDWLWPQIMKVEKFIISKMGDSPYQHDCVRWFVNETLHQKWIGHKWDLRHYPLCYFLVGICKTNCLCFAIASRFGWNENQDHSSSNFCNRSPVN